MDGVGLGPLAATTDSELMTEIIQKFEKALTDRKAYVSPVEKGKMYYYKVVATSDSGDGDMSRLADAKIQKEEEPGFLAGFLVVTMALGALIASRRLR